MNKKSLMNSKRNNIRTQHYNIRTQHYVIIFKAVPLAYFPISKCIFAHFQHSNTYFGSPVIITPPS